MQNFEYGNMGELTKNIHTFVVPGGVPYTFQTEWEYDSWNRIKNIQYPDGEILFPSQSCHHINLHSIFNLIIFLFLHKQIKNER
jgi:hypothetical protein